MVTAHPRTLPLVGWYGKYNSAGVLALDHDRLRLHAISALDHGLSLCLRG